jgi:hypothetical protein
LTDPSRVGRPSKFTTNLKILVLTEVGRLKDALQLIRYNLKLFITIIVVNAPLFGKKPGMHCQGQDLLVLFF